MRMRYYLYWSIVQVDFLIVRAPLAYNAIIGRPGLNAFWAVTSTYCMKIKFPTVHVIEEICKDQSLACHCYHIVLRGTKITNTYPIEGLYTCDDLAKQQGEPVKDLIFVSLVDENQEHIVRIGSNLDEVTKTNWSRFHKKIVNIFAWTLIDMQGIDPLVMVHQLNVYPKHRSFKQKK